MKKTPTRLDGAKGNVHFGSVGRQLPDWRPILEDEPDPDDEELDETPQHVTDALGVDPLDLF